MVKLIIFKQILKKLYLLRIFFIFILINKLHNFADLIKKSILRLRLNFLKWLIRFLILLSTLNMIDILIRDLVLDKIIGVENRTFYVFKLHLKIFGVIHEVFRFETDIALFYFLHVLRVNILLISFHADTSLLFASRLSSHFHIFLIHLPIKLDFFYYYIYYDFNYFNLLFSCISLISFWIKISRYWCNLSRVIFRLSRKKYYNIIDIIYLLPDNFPLE